MDNTLIDNSCPDLSMTKILKDCLNEQGLEEVRIATGYWDIPGLALLTQEIKAFLQKDNTKLLLLIGKDPYVYASQMREPKYMGAEYPKDYIRTDINELEVVDEYKEAISMLLDHCTDCNDSKIQIRIFLRNESGSEQFLHSKCYIFKGENSQFGYGIVGSSNFTKKGLEGNSELNFVETSRPSVISTSHIPGCKTHLEWFDEKWNISEPWNRQFVEQVLAPTPIVEAVKKEKEEKAKELLKIGFTPYELYIKLLQHKFDAMVDCELNMRSFLPQSVKPLSFQLQAAQNCISIMKAHGGFMLADVVGLGKTIVASLIIKSFITKDYENREQDVLIITPPSIQPGWKETIALFDEDRQDKMGPHIDFITTGSISKVLHDGDNDDEEDYDEDIFVEADEAAADFGSSIKQKNYGLIIIDESHRFRNSGTQMYKELERLIGDIEANTGLCPYVGLLSATPQNNRPRDLKNQIYLFERQRADSTLRRAKGGNLETFFSEIEREYDELIKPDGDTSEEAKERYSQRLKDISEKLRECVLEDILERRTRTDIRKYYFADMVKQELHFPEICGPTALNYTLDRDLARRFYTTMECISPTNEISQKTALCFARFRAIQYFVDPTNTQKYKSRGSNNADSVANRLAAIVQTRLVKRLESSFDAFVVSINNLRKSYENMIEMWKDNTIFVCPSFSVNDELDTEKKNKSRQECYNDIRAKIATLDATRRNKEKKNMEYHRSDFRSEYYDMLCHDSEVVEKLCGMWNEKTPDPKLSAFKNALTKELLNPDKNMSGKLVIFSEAIATTEVLQRVVEDAGYKALCVNASNRTEKQQLIRANFDANNFGKAANDYQVIITTDVLAEGINLHRANVILNYDTPWNATRLMQRIGRVNRIGSEYDEIRVYNFMPSAEGDEEINLVRKAYTKIQSFHILFGEDSKIFSDDEKVAHYELRKAADGEESPLEKYLYELKEYKRENPERYDLIKQSNDNWQIASQSQGRACFLIKVPESTVCRHICVDTSTMDAKVISEIDAFESVKVDAETPRVGLPDNWEEVKDKAVLTMHQSFVHFRNGRRSRNQDDARAYIVELTRMGKETFSAKTKEMLNRASRCVSDNNIGIIKCILKIKKYAEGAGANLLAQTDEAVAKSIEEYIKDKLFHMLSAKDTTEEANQVLIGTCVG